MPMQQRTLQDDGNYPDIIEVAAGASQSEEVEMIDVPNDIEEYAVAGTPAINAAKLILARHEKHRASLPQEKPVTSNHTAPAEEQKPKRKITIVVLINRVTDLNDVQLAECNDQIMFEGLWYYEQGLHGMQPLFDRVEGQAEAFLALGVIQNRRIVKGQLEPLRRVRMIFKTMIAIYRKYNMAGPWQRYDKKHNCFWEICFEIMKRQTGTAFMWQCDADTLHNIVQSYKFAQREFENIYCQMVVNKPSMVGYGVKTIQVEPERQIYVDLLPDDDVDTRFFVDRKDEWLKKKIDDPELLEA